MIEVLEELQNRVKENKASVLITITASKGSSPGKPGFKMLIGDEGRLSGTVGGGGAEYYAISRARELLTSGISCTTETLVLKESAEKVAQPEKREDGKIEIPSLCGGEVTLFYEVFSQANMLYIFGAGHVGQALAKMARLLNYYVVIVDNREDVLSEVPLNYYSEKHYADFPKLAFEAKPPFDINTQSFSVILTHNHLNDMNVLHYLYKNYPDLKYVGLIGSVRKVKEAVSFVSRELGEKVNFENLYAPIGLDLGGNTPGEIALSILSEIQAIRHKKEQKHLRLEYKKFL